ncbi:response regulator [Azospirillum sp. SYSU D00513]|uniref:response regulator n=1 Tax=Azospirillum sp. SYSU D00513 TaxID=2812561 RepID=UPI001A95E506
MTKRVLIAEDEVLIAMGFEMALEEAGFEVTLAYDGLSALDRYASEPADLVMVDVGLPKMNGLDLVRMIRQRNPDQRILIVSGNIHRGTIHDGIPGEPVPVLTKPVSFKDLVNAVRNGLSEAVA